MPGLDGTGPRGMGPMTGGGRGFCVMPLGGQPRYVPPVVPMAGFYAARPWTPFLGVPTPWTYGYPWAFSPWATWLGRRMGLGFGRGIGAGFGRGIGFGIRLGRGWRW